MNYTTVTLPTWANPEHTAIDCLVVFDTLGEVPFTASSLDTADHSRDIFDKVCKGVFGIVADCPIPILPAVTPLTPEQSLAGAKLKAAAGIADKRYVRETSGITVNGFRIATTRQAQSQLFAAYASLANKFVTSIDWKLGADSFVPLDLADITVIAKRVTEHVQKCFSAEKALVARVFAAGTLDEVLALESTPLEGI